MSTDWMIAEDKIGNFWKRAIMTFFDILNHLQGILSNTTKSFSYESRSLDRDLNPRPLEYEARVLLK
jgi:hypothetical protein